MHAYASASSSFTRRLLIVLYTLDSLVLALLTLGNCKIGETLSSVAWVTESDGKLVGRVLRPVFDTLLWFEPDHCYNAWLTYRRITNSQDTQ